MIYRFLTAPPADPFEYGVKVTGETALRLLLATLAITPIRLITGYKRLGIFRRNLGVLAFVYVVVHFNLYMFLEAQFSIAYILEDIQDRRYITVGFAAFLLIVPLAITSNNFSVKKLGAKWQKLHRLMYPLSIFACVHFLWVERGDGIGESAVYAGVAVVLLAARLVYKLLKKKRITV